MVPLAAAATRDGASDLSSGPSVRKRAREWSGDIGPLIKGSGHAVQHIRAIASTLWPRATQLAEIWYSGRWLYLHGQKGARWGGVPV
ncbi:hypothetical protein MTO96_012123 [Rhipicephalus appendiculatus]